MSVQSGQQSKPRPLISTVNKHLDEHSRSLTLPPPPPPPPTGETFASGRRAASDSTPPTYDPVLRFYAYFRQTVCESNDETVRVRYVRLHVFLDDDTVMIEENRVRNSGLPQGVLLRRMRVLNPSAARHGVQYVSSDFAVGRSIEICGIVYRLYACDKFTEDYLHSVGRPVAPFEDPPDDLYSIKRQLTERPIRVGKVASDPTHLRQFLDFDGKVLRFWAIWDDRDSLFGELRHFTLQYFLVDDTIEVRQLLKPNSGRDNVSQFLKKSRIVNPQTHQPYRPDDLRIGAVVHVHGRDFLLYDADEFTQQYIDQHFGPHDWTPLDVAVRARERPARAAIPPHNGWGDEEDSLGNCVSLHPRPPPKDVRKLRERQAHVLRFAAHLKNPMPQDRMRRFVAAFYLADDTLAVFEIPQRNSGFREGKFLQRGKWRNGFAGGRQFVASDFRIGGEIAVNGFVFVLQEADEYALCLMEAEADDFPQADLAPIFAEMARNAAGKQKMRALCEARDATKRGVVDPGIAKQGLQRVFYVDEHEALTVVRRYSSDWGFDYRQFLADLA